MNLDLAVWQKIQFISTKYIVLFKNYFFGFTAGVSYASIFGKRYYYDDKFGIAYLQSLYVDNAFLKKYISSKSTIIDIGANIGQFNFFCSQYLRASKIYSFEPVKRSFDLLSKNADKNIYNYAISTKKNETFFIPVTTLMASKYKLTQDDEHEKIKGMRLDSFVKKNHIAKIGLFKIDTEGSEYNVLETSKNTIKKSKYILLEASVKRQSSGNIWDCIGLLRRSIPNILLSKTGRIFKEHDKIVAVDLLFKRN